MRQKPGLTWGMVGYVACLAFVALLVSPFLPDLFRSACLPEGNWQPADANETVPMPLTIFLVLAPIITLLYTAAKSARSPGWRVASPWLIARSVLVGLILFLYAGAFVAVGKAREAWDKRTRDLVAQLKPGMPRKEVDRHMEAAAPLSHLHSARGPVVPHVQIYNRRYNQGFGSDEQTVYALRIEYTSQEKLKAARYSGEKYVDGNREWCKVFAELPPAMGYQYPYPCPLAAAAEKFPPP